MNHDKNIAAFKSRLTADLRRVDFAVLRENWNRLFEREKHTRIVYEDEDAPMLLESEWYGDDVFLKEQLLKEIGQMADRFSRPGRGSRARNFAQMLDFHFPLLEALAITMNADFRQYARGYERLYEED